MQNTKVHLTVHILMTREGRNMQERIRAAYTVALDQTPRLPSTLMEDCSLDIDSNATNKRRKLPESRRTFR